MKHYPIHSKVDRAISYGNKELLYFSGTSYLGMGNLPEFEKLIVSGIRKYGASHGSSRGSNLQLQVYEDFEKFFSHQAGADRGLLFSSGFMAGSAAVKVLKATSDLIIAAPDAHPAILPNEQTPHASMSFEAWSQHCLALAQTCNGKHISFLSNAVDPLKLKIHTFDWLNDLPNSNTYTLLIDDSHAFGLIGNDIYGTYKKWSQLPADIITCGSLCKALGIPGGVVLASRGFIGRLEQETMFRSASPPAPAFYDAFLNSQPLYAHQKAKLEANVRLFKNISSDLYFLNSVDDYPVFAFDDESLVEKLEQDNIIISSFPYPNMTDPCVNRIVISAYHEEEDLYRLAASLKKHAPII
jgi:8-amino-7-oxononanoate synthase